MSTAEFSLKKKFFIIFSVSVVFILAIIAIGILGMIKIKNESVRIYEESFLEAQRLLALDRDFEKSRRALLSLLLEYSGNKRLESIKKIEDVTRSIDNTFRYMLSEDNHFDSEAISHITKLNSIWDAFKYTRDNELIPAILGGNIEYAKTLATSVQGDRFNEFVAIIEMLIDHESAEAAMAQARVQSSLQDSIIMYAVITLGGFLVAVILIVSLSRDISGRLKAVTEALTKVKEGELDFAIDVKGKDEISYVAVNLNKMIRQLFEDRIMNEQAMTILKWYSDESAKEVEKLARLNNVLTQTQDELSIKNKSLEGSLRELKEVNQKLAETRAQMIQSEKMASIGQLAAGVAHEINNPIGFVNSNLNTLSIYIGNFTSLLRMYFSLLEALEAGETDKAMKHVKEIKQFLKDFDLAFTVEDIVFLTEESKDGVQRVKSIVGGLKDFAHASSKEKGCYDLNLCLENSIKIIWHEMKYKVELERDFGDIPLVLCHPEQMGQVFMNLIVNAVHAIPEKGKISIKTYAKDGNVFVMITDDGAGIPQDIIHRVFEPFFTTKPVGKGTGLGLSIAYGIIEDHNGAITVESKVGEGTTFTVSLPVLDKNAATPGVLQKAEGL